MNLDINIDISKFQRAFRNLKKFYLKFLNFKLKIESQFEPSEAWAI